MHYHTLLQKAFIMFLFLYFIFAVLGLNPELCIRGKCSTTELLPSSLFLYFKNTKCPVSVLVSFRGNLGSPGTGLNVKPPFSGGCYL
jgi:hypothetical protein